MRKCPKTLDRTGVVFVFLSAGPEQRVIAQTRRKCLYSGAFRAQTYTKRTSTLPRLHLDCPSLCPCVSLAEILIKS